MEIRYLSFGEPKISRSLRSGIQMMFMQISRQMNNFRILPKDLHDV